MSEDALVNTGAVRWPDLYSAGVAVRRMQAKLHLWAARDPGRRFGDLFNLVYDPAFLVVAWERVSANKGAGTPGIDKVTAADIEARAGVAGLLGCIRDELKSGSFRPVEVRRVLIPKSNGKLRKLGIPVIADRVVQASLKLVLEPIFEAVFKPCSYGFRPNRRAQDAISDIHHLASRPSNYQWVLEADIKACFDEISHTALMDRVRVRVKDKRVCALVRAFLKSGVLTEFGDREETHTGTPQGGIISPLMANIARSALDDHFDQQWKLHMPTEYQRAKRRRNGKANYKIIRYADDFVIMVSGDRHHAEELREYRSTRHEDLDELLRSLNMSLAGWANYFRHGASKAIFSAVDYHAWHRLMRWIRVKYKGRTGLSMKEMRRRFCDTGWRFACNGVVFTGASSVRVTRYRYRGGNIPTPWTPGPLAVPSG
jgi:RNA-directed DNA polymerase